MSTNSASFFPNPCPEAKPSPSLDPDRYNDIINHPRPISKTHPQMSLEARSAQFAPFATLNRYHETIRSIEETAKNQLDTERASSLIDLEQPTYLEDLNI